MTRLFLPLVLLASTAFAETGVVVDFKWVLEKSNYGYRAREAAQARTKDQSSDEKKKAEREEYEKVYAIAFPLLVDYAKRSKLDFVFLEERGVVFASSLLSRGVSADLIEALNAHSRDGRGSLKAIKPSEYLTLRVAVVNVEAAFNHSKTGLAAKERMKEQFKKAQAQLDALQAEAKELLKKAEAEKKGTPEYETANAAAVDKMRSVMNIKQMREYELKFFEQKEIEDVIAAVGKAAAAVAEAQNYNLVLSPEDARVVGLAPVHDLTEVVLTALDAPEAPVKKKPAPKPTALATIGARELWANLLKANPKANPGSEIPAAGMKYAASAGLDLVLDEEVLVYANPARSRTTELGAKLTGE